VIPLFRVSRCGNKANGSRRDSHAVNEPIPRRSLWLLTLTASVHPINSSAKAPTAHAQQHSRRSMEHHLRCPNSFCPAISARIRVTAQSPKKIKNKIFAISAASEAMPPYPSAAAIREMTRKTTDHLSIYLSFLQAAPQRSPAVGVHIRRAE